MLKWFSHNRSDITFWIAFIGFVMSSATWIRSAVSLRRNLKGTILKIKSYADVTYVYLLLENRSSLPIAVNQIVLRTISEDSPCTPLPTQICRTLLSEGDKVIIIVKNIPHRFRFKSPV